MSLLRVAKALLAGYPGGYKHMARGSQGIEEPSSFKVPDNERDRRSRIPPLGYKEYWYPALPDADVSWKKPSVLRIQEQDVVFFRGQDGQVKALADHCPHRGAYLSMGDCFYKGFLSCPYHGATFDGDGNCVAFLSEGPDSRMVGEMKATSYPTVTLKGMVFAWMGEGEPVDPREDIPPEMFEEHNFVRYSFCMFNCNWVLCLENTFDAHNGFWVHRDAIRVLFNGSPLGGRPRTPLGYRPKIINGKVVHYQPSSGKTHTERYYYDEDGNIPYQMYYPGVDGYWPLNRWRQRWSPFFNWLLNRNKKTKTASASATTGNGTGTGNGNVKGNNTWPFNRARMDENEWNGTRLPGMSRTGGAQSDFRSTRWPVPVEKDITRMIYLNVWRHETAPSFKWKLINTLTWPFVDWSLNFNFRNQDRDAEKYCRYDLPEYLSSTDAVVIAMRKLFTEYNRDLERAKLTHEHLEESIEDEMVKQSEELVLNAHSDITLNATRLREELLSGSGSRDS